jgi:hypothetical protein
MSAPLPLEATGPLAHVASALLLGGAFGVALERAGLGDARKLTGQFYGTDFAVFKVMFTAIVTCMIGLMALGTSGVVDRSRLRVPPTYLLPQAVGGIVFGVGFVLGGYCPGTGCTAAASGRLDALATVAGLLGGTWLFGEVFPALRGLYEATPIAASTLPDLFGLAEGVVAVGVLVLALAAFAVAERLERRSHA